MLWVVVLAGVGEIIGVGETDGMGDTAAVGVGVTVYDVCATEIKGSIAKRANNRPFKMALVIIFISKKYPIVLNLR